MFSIRKRLLASVIVVLLFSTFCEGIATYFAVQQQVDRLLDNSLKQVALSLNSIHSGEIPFLKKGALLPADDSLVVQIHDPISGMTFISRNMEKLPIAERTGFSDILIDGRPWRLYTSQNLTGQIVEVAQPAVLRSEVAIKTAKPILIPLIVAVPVIALILWIFIRHGFSSLEGASRAIARRSPTSLQPLSMKGMPVELAPLVNSLNDLLARLSDSFKLQSRFASDAAHELRTPLTALNLQIQLAERAKTEEAKAKAFGRLKEGIKRATRLVTQLLTMARLDPDNSEKPMAPLDLHALATSIQDEISVVAEQKGIEISTLEKSKAIVFGNKDALQLMITNLCDNAIRYTPEGGHIRIATGIENGNAIVEVSDDGPGIPEAERARIFERFYRAEGTKTIPGTGIGLAIVRRVAELHGGKPSLEDGLDGKGITFKISFPATQKQRSENQDEADDEYSDN